MRQVHCTQSFDVQKLEERILNLNQKYDSIKFEKNIALNPKRLFQIKEWTAKQHFSTVNSTYGKTKQLKGDTKKEDFNHKPFRAIRLSQLQA